MSDALHALGERLSATDARASERAAQRRWATLLSWDPREPERAELRAAGVASATVATLYPFDFDVLAPHFAAAIQRSGFSSQPITTKEWQACADRGLKVSQTFAAAVRARWVDAGSESDGESYIALWKVCKDRLELQTSIRTSTVAAMMVERLWDACWFMVHISESEQPRAVHEFFIDITERLLPALGRSRSDSLS